MVLDLECQGNEVGFASGITRRNVWRGFEPAIIASWRIILPVPYLARTSSD